MKVYIANFGRSNYEWPICLERSTVATMIHEHTRVFYDAGDREGFVDWCVANRKTARGITPTRPVASRWYGAMETVEHTEGDIWIHRADNQLWWTVSTSAAAEWTLKPSGDPKQNGRLTYVCHKPCLPWSDRNKKGQPMLWNALHPRAQQFLFTEGTLQKLSDDNTEYALALIEGMDLTPWHLRLDWKAKVERSKRNPGKTFNAKEITIYRMVQTVQDTVLAANGQVVERTLKNKDMLFDKEQLSRYIEQLLDEQEGRCALTDIPMQYDREFDDPELRCSLDRIDSNGHYEEGNLQVVCRFVNRWKSNGEDAEFRRLIGVVRDVQG